MSIAELIEMEKEVIQKEYELKIKCLEDQIEFGSVGDTQWLKDRLSIQSLTVIKERLLYPFRKELEGRIIYYSDKKGVPFRINKALFNDWLVNNFERIDWSDK